MDQAEVQFVLFGIKWTLPLIGSAILGVITAAGGLYKIWERWSTREARHLQLLHDYLDKEEHDITSRRRKILTSIGLAEHSYLVDKGLDVGAEIDDAIKLLDQGRPDRAEARLKELLKKIQNNSKILERRVADLERHERSVNIFLAAVAEAEGRADIGLGYVSDAMVSDGRDLDALRYKGELLLQKQETSLAEQTFERLKNYSNGKPANRAEAYLGLGRVAVKRGTPEFGQAEQALSNALSNMNGLAPSDQSPLTRAEIYQLLAEVLSTEGWDGFDIHRSIDCYRNAIQIFDQFPSDNRKINDRKRELYRKLGGLENKLTIN